MRRYETLETLFGKVDLSFAEAVLSNIKDVHYKGTTYILHHNRTCYTIGGATIRKLAYSLLIYGIISLILTILVNDQIIYITIDAIVSFWSYVFFVFNPFPMLYRSALVLQHGPSVWINSITMIIILFIYPTIVVAIGLVLFFKYGRLIRQKK
jgi:hypothetical protein